MSYPSSMLLGTEPAIETLEALRVITILVVAAVSGPLFIGGLFFILRKSSNRT